MEPQMPTSFIPKRVLDKPGRAMVRPTGLLLVISIVILFISVVLLGGSYFYKQLLEKRVVTLDESVKVERKNLDQSTILSFQRLDHKLRIAENLINKHISILPLFTLLEDLTLPTVRYTNFSYTAKAVSITGQATSYEDIAVQTKVFSSEKTRIQSFIFSDLNLDPQGNVSFKLTIVPETGITAYAKTLNI